MTSTDVTTLETGIVVSLASELETIDAAIRRAERARDSYMAAGAKARTIAESAQLEVVGALARISEGELWRESGARSWSGWLKAGGAGAVGFLGGRVQAQRLVAAWPLLESGSQNGLGTNERQARELLKVPEDDRPEVVERAAATGKMTAAAITQAAAEVAAGVPAGPSPALLAAVQSAVRKALDGGWSLSEIHQAVTDAPVGALA